MHQTSLPAEGTPRVPAASRNTSDGPSLRRPTSLIHRLLGVASSALCLLGAQSAAQASTAYGTLNNFDCVNDTGVEAHGFEIELDDVRSRDITYTYDYNHYGIPKIIEDSTDPLHPRVFVRYAANRLANGTWSAFTAIPAGPILPTDGHQFTNPSINFGGEHFGVGYYGAPSAVKYNWLVDDGTGNLVHGPAVYISTPVFTYYPPVVAQPVPQVQAVVVPPPPPAPPVLQFGEAVWVNDIKTTTHNANKVELVDLRDPDPNDPNVKDWANGEPAEVESEWRIMQTEFANAGNPKGEVVGVPEDLPGGDEVITRRYEFFKYVGPIDAESGEAMADVVGPDGIHGVGVVTYIDSFDAQGEPVEVTVDLSEVVVVGDFIGAQMSGFDVAPALGLIDHIPDGEVGVPYAERSVVVSGGAAFFAQVTGNLPDGTSFDAVSGIFSGTPSVPGVFTFSVEASDLSGAVVSNSYTVTIVGDLPPPVTFTIATSAVPVAGGITSGGGVANDGDSVTVVATANAGYAFVNWTDGGVEVSNTASYVFVATADRSLVANFVRITHTIATGAAPVAGGITSSGGVVNDGDSVTVVATANPGYVFVNWTEGGVEVSNTASYTFVATTDRSLVANFAAIPQPNSVSLKKLEVPRAMGSGKREDGEVKLATPAPAGGAVVLLSSSNPSVLEVPVSVFVPAGERSASFRIRTLAVAAPTAVDITAKFGTSQITERVRVLARRKADLDDK